MDPSTPTPTTVTVIYGQSSFIGRCLVSALLNSSPHLTVRIADPNPPAQSDPDRIHYFQTRLHDPSHLRSAIDGSSAVFHIDPTIGVPPPSTSAADFFKTHSLVVGVTRNVVRVCRELGVRRLVYTGSADVVFDGVHDVIDANESLPYPDKFQDVLNDLRAQAEMIVLNANGRDGISTCVLRTSNPFGQGDDHFVPFLVSKAKSAWSKFIIGSGKNMCDFTYVENVAHANICAEKALCSGATSIAGEPLFITNLEKMKFWDFNSDILEGLGYQRPYIHLPLQLVLLFLALVEGLRGKLQFCKTYDLFLSPLRVRALTCTRTFDSSKAQKLIGYSPTTSLEDGITVTVKSFFQLAKGSIYSRQRDFSRPSKAESVLGNGKVADILLWRDEKRTFTYLMALFLLFHWFILSGRTFISSTSKFLLLVSLILFGQGILPSSMFGFTIEKMPSSYFEVSDLAIRDSLAAVAAVWNNGLHALKSVAQGRNWDAFVKVAGSLYLLKLFLPFSFSVLIAVGVVCLFSIFLIYEQYEEEVDNLVIVVARGIKQIQDLLSAKLSTFLSTYVHNS